MACKVNSDEQENPEIFSIANDLVLSDHKLSFEKDLGIFSKSPSPVILRTSLFESLTMLCTASPVYTRIHSLVAAITLQGAICSTEAAAIQSATHTLMMPHLEQIWGPVSYSRTR